MIPTYFLTQNDYLRLPGGFPCQMCFESFQPGEECTNLQFQLAPIEGAVTRMVHVACVLDFAKQLNARRLSELDDLNNDLNKLSELLS